MILRELQQIAVAVPFFALFVFAKWKKMRDKSTKTLFGEGLSPNFCKKYINFLE